MTFYRLQSITNLWMHPYPHFLLPPPHTHHHETPHQCRSTTDPLGEGYHQGERNGHPADLSCTSEDSLHSRLGTAMVEQVLPSEKSAQPGEPHCREPSPD